MRLLLSKMYIFTIFEKLKLLSLYYFCGLSYFCNKKKESLRNKIIGSLRKAAISDIFLKWEYHKTEWTKQTLIFKEENDYQNSHTHTHKHTNIHMHKHTHANLGHYQIPSSLGLIFPFGKNPGPLLSLLFLNWIFIFTKISK